MIATYQQTLFTVEGHRADPHDRITAPPIVLACFNRERQARTLAEFCEERLADDLLWSSLAPRVRALRTVAPMEVETCS